MSTLQLPKGTEKVTVITHATVHGVSGEDYHYTNKDGVEIMLAPDSLRVKNTSGITIHPLSNVEGLILRTKEEVRKALVVPVANEAEASQEEVLEPTS